jgi:hypothetical protein
LRACACNSEMVTVDFNRKIHIITKRLRQADWWPNLCGPGPIQEPVGKDVRSFKLAAFERVKLLTSFPTILDVLESALVPRRCIRGAGVPQGRRVAFGNTERQTVCVWLNA